MRRKKSPGCADKKRGSEQKERERKRTGNKKEKERENMIEK